MLPMKIRTLAVGNFAANCYILADEERHALVIDPGDDPDLIERTIRDNRLTVAAYLITHGHMDHVSALAEMERRLPAPVGIHPADAKWAFGGANQMPPWYETPSRPGNLQRAFSDNQDWTDFGMHYRVVATPGHTPGCVCFYFPEENVIFTGDTLFAGSVGRTDFPGGDDRALNQSLRRLAELPDDSAVFAGHGPQTTIGHEKKTNPFMRF
jgi:hydroxyacylglutathione hydrolase